MYEVVVQDHEGAQIFGQDYKTQRNAWKAVLRLRNQPGYYRVTYALVEGGKVVSKAEYKHDGTSQIWHRS